MTTTKRESSISSQRPERIRHVLPQLAHDMRSVHSLLPLLIHDDTILTNDVDVAELTQRLLAGGVGGPACRHETLRPHLEVKCQLVIHLARDVCATKWQAKDAAHLSSGRQWGSRGERFANRARVSLPRRDFSAQLLFAGAAQLVVLRAPIVVRVSPLGGEPPVSLEAMQRV
jgi:hypothetical protein